MPREHAGKQVKMIPDHNAPLSRPIIHVVTTIMRGGAENQLLILVGEQVRLGFSVTVLYLKGEPELSAEFENVGAQVIYDLANIHPLLQIKNLKTFLKNSNYQSAVIHSHLPRAQILTATSIRKTQTLICSRHDEDNFYPRANKFLSLVLFRYVDRKVDTWIAISNGVKEKMISFGEIGKATRIKVIYYGLPSGLKMTKAEKSKDSPIIVGCVARLVWQKDHLTLLKAFRIFVSKFTNAQLLIVGDGPLRNDLERKCKDLGMEEKVNFVGKVDDVFRYLKNMDIFVLPSSTEGFGLALLEAMSANISVIASDIPARSEVLSGNGLLFKTGDHLELSEKMVELADGSKRAEIAERGYKRSKDFDPKRMCLEVIKVYGLAT